MLAAVVLLLRSSRQPVASAGQSWILRHALTVLPGVLPFIVGGLYWTLAGMLGALVGAVINAWVLLVEILR